MYLFWFGVSALSGLKCYDDTQWSDISVRQRKHSSGRGTEMRSSNNVPSKYHGHGT